MKKIKEIIFISNYFNHHQKYFCEEMYNILGDGFKFIETSKMTFERRNMGWGENNLPMYVISEANYKDKMIQCQELINKADVVIIGSAPEFLITTRKRENKLVFRYSERPLKKGLEPLKYLFRFVKWNYINRSNNIYMLCASAYTSADYSKFFLFKNKCYKWGYFPRVFKYEDIDEIIKCKKKTSILWAGRFIDWKHPEVAIKVAERLKNEGYDFKLSIIGIGELENNLTSMISDKKLSDCISILGAMSPDEVRKNMLENEIFLFTSDRNEGWGAVLNESMNSGCAVVASHAIGSVPFLLESEKNGLIYKDGDFEDFYKKVRKLLDDDKLRYKLGKNAYLTMAEMWSSENAAKRLIELAQTILNGDKNSDIFEIGVCSKAKEIKDDWFAV